MALITRLQNFFNKSKTTPPKLPGFTVEYAFECGGIKYYEFTDPNNLPALRALNAMTFYDELRNGVSKEYLNAHIEAGDKLFSNPKQINLQEVILYHNRLKERLKFVISKEIIYKIASIAFIDEHEDPTSYDFAYNKKKIDNWITNGADGFFLQMPLKRLIPFLKQYGSYSLDYLKIVEKLEKVQLNIHSLQMFAEELQDEKD